MKIIKSKLSGVAEIESNPFVDHRGWFVRYFCQEQIKELNGGKEIVQINSSFTKRKGTIRGLHFQNSPYCEDKIVRCLSGQIFDVVLDLRLESKTFGQWQSIILDSEKMNMVYIPKGFAHGFQTLTDNCQILYLHTEYRNQKSEDGYYYNSPYLGIDWPLELTDISERDKNLKIFDKSSKKIKL